MTSAIFTRGTKYLNARYHWAHIPHLFPAWQFEDVLGLAMGFPDRPDGYAMASGDVIDLDALDVIRLDRRKNMSIEEFIKENGLCTVCAGAGDLWNGDPEQDAPICEHCGGSGKEPVLDNPQKAMIHCLK